MYFKSVSITLFFLFQMSKTTASHRKRETYVVNEEAEGGRPSAIWMENRSQEKNIVGRAENSN